MAADVTLSNIEGLSAGEIELLEAVGVDRLTTLARSSSSVLLRELKQANVMLGVLPELPEENRVEKWIAQATELAGHRLEAKVNSARPLQASTRGVTRLLPTAVPISPRSLMNSGIKLQDVPVLEELDWELSGEDQEKLAADVTAAAKKPAFQPKPSPVAAVAKEVAPVPDKKSFSVNRKFNQDGQIEGDSVAQPLAGKGRQLVNAPRAQTNEGLNPHSRRYVRGVLHPRPWHVRMGAIASLLALPTLPFPFIGLALMAAYREQWYYFLPLPLITLVFGVLYLMIATKPRCRICGQPLFVPKRCFRHVKAHHVRLIGYIIPTSLQLLIFKWFRCIFCGTSIRLKE